MAYGIVVGVPSGLLGLIVGRAGGHTDKYIINEQKILPKRINYVRIEAMYIQYENDENVIVEYKNRKIRLARFQTKQIDDSGTRIMITIPMDIYQEKFH